MPSNRFGDPGPEVRRRLAEAELELAEIGVDRAASEAEFRDRVRGLLERSSDEAAHHDIWDYLEEKTDRRELRRRPAFAALWAAERDAEAARFEQEGVVELLRAYQEGLAAQDSPDGQPGGAPEPQVIDDRAARWNL